MEDDGHQGNPKQKKKKITAYLLFWWTEVVQRRGSGGLWSVILNAGQWL